jgi:zinc protease
VILKPTDFANEQIYLSASRPGGMTLFAQQDIVNARYANAVVATMGINGLSPIDLQKVLAGKTAAVSTNFGPYADGVGGFAGSTDIETMLQMLYLKFTNVRRDQDLYTSFLGKQVESARNVMAQPQAVFSAAIITAMYGASPWAQHPARPQDFDKLNLDRSIALYKERFTSARGMTFIMVGNFDIAKLKPLIATYMASLPTGELPIGVKDVGLRPARGVIRQEVFSGAEAKSQVAIDFTGDAVYSRDASMRFHALLDVMNIRITDVLREKLTLIYGGRMGGSFERIPYGHYAIAASLPTGPANVDKVIAAVFAEIAQMKEQGPTAADLAKVKENWLQVHRRALRENRYWLAQLQASVIEDSDPALILTYEQRVAAITAPELQDAARRYFDLQNYVQVVLYPEKK